MRDYLMRAVMPTLTQGLIECYRTLPDDPIDFLVGWSWLKTVLFIYFGEHLHVPMFSQAEYLLKNNPEA